MFICLVVVVAMHHEIFNFFPPYALYQNTSSNFTRQEYDVIKLAHRCQLKYNTVELFCYFISYSKSAFKIYTLVV
jgi:hypothetical protein